MFGLCEAMKWSHLPNAGGLYDQDPELLDAFRIIFAFRNKHEAEEQRKQETKNGMKPTSRSGGRKRSR